MNFSLRINCDNAAFADRYAGTEVARILHNVAERVANDPVLTRGDSFKLVDLNGNVVGEAKVTGK